MSATLKLKNGSAIAINPFMQIIMENELPVIAVLLTCHNRKDKTLHCLQCLFKQEGMGTVFNIEVFLVDDGSTDGTSAMVKTLYPSVTVIPGSGNLYWNRGMHMAWKTASEKKEYDHYLWLNDDTNIFPDALTVLLVNNLKAGSNAIICGATKSEITHEYTYGGELDNGKQVVPNGSLQECKFMNGNVVLINRGIFKKMGFMDPVFHHAIGDRDYGLRAIKKGIRVLITPVYIAYCEGHVRLPKWCLTSIPLKERMAALYSPLGNSHPYYFFVYEKRHFGLLSAVKHFFSIHLRMLIPSLWK